MNFFSADGQYSNSGLIENFKQSSTTFNLKPAFKEFTKDVNKALAKIDYSSFKSNDFLPVNNIIKKKEDSPKPLELRDKEENPFFVKVNNKNQICVTKNNQTLCLADKDFKSVGPSLSSSKINDKINKNRLKSSSLTEKEINRLSTSNIDKNFEKNFEKSNKIAKKSSPKINKKVEKKVEKKVDKIIAKKLNKEIRKSLSKEETETETDSDSEKKEDKIISKKINKEIRKSLPKEETENTTETDSEK
jgi:hypothetical protein